MFFTILGPHDFVVIVRSRRQPGPVRRAGAWRLAGVADDAAVAASMADLIMSSNPLEEAQALSHSGLLHELHGADRERIFDLLNSRTTAEVARADALRQTALARLADVQRDKRAGVNRRSGRDRRTGQERRQPRSPLVEGVRVARQRRTGRDRRSGHDRRGEFAEIH